MSSATLHLTADRHSIDAAVQLLREGRLVAFPTETVYGLGADATNGRAVAGIYEAKGRPRFNPLIAHLSSFELAREQGLFSPAAERLAKAFWPGPLTLVVPKSPHCTVSEIATAGLDSVALRVPDHVVSQAILAGVGRPVAAPSANRSGHVSATTAAHVAADLDGRIAAVVDGGATPVGVESTILACLGDDVAMLRPGGLSREAIEDALGFSLAEGAEGSADEPLSPGMLASHYAPRAPVRLDARRAGPTEAWLGFGGRGDGREALVAADLSPTGDLTEAAATLFGMMRALDRPDVTAIAVAPIPTRGLGEAIRDRLARAAAER